MNQETYEKWERLCERIKAEGCGSLREWEYDWINVRALIDSINNGGMISYFYNSSGDKLIDCLAALDRLRASDVKRQVLKLCELFPLGVPKTVNDRNCVITSWDDDVDITLNHIDDSTFLLLDELETKLDDLVANYCSTQYV